LKSFKPAYSEKTFNFTGLGSAFKFSIAVSSSDGEALRLNYNRRLKLQFRGLVATSGAGFLAYRELDDVLGLTMAGERD
jgi:hypothetical protein